MRWRALLVAVVTIWVVVGAGEVGAQSTLGAPTIASITATTNTLTVSWSAPVDDGGSAITAYDVRYIRTDASDKTVDANWTVEEGIWSSGTLEYYELTGLVDGVGYDVQVRAENANGKGPSWSATVTGATTDHADTIATATALPLSSSLPGSLDPADDEDVFSIVLTSAADLWVYTTGDTPTVGKLLDSSGGELKEARATTLLDAPRGFALRSELSAGTYYVRVSSYRAREAGSYTIHAQTVTDPGNTIASATPVTLDSATPGRIGPEAGGSVDTDVYQLVLNASTDIWVMAIGEHEGAGDAGPLDTVGELLDSAGSQLTENDDSKFPNNEKGFILRRTLRAGTYYIRVQGYGSRHIGPYTLHVRTAAEPGSTTATAAPLTLRVPETGRISPRDDRDYFSLTLAEETYVFIVAMTFGSALPLTPTILDDEGNTVTAHVVTHADYVGRGRSEVSFTVRARLDAGTYHLRVRRAGSATGRYLLVPFVSADGVVAKRCTDITTAQSDPWYGCQWHLKNTGQFGSGALQDINVESVWTSGNMGAGVNVVVVDDGLHSGHEDLTDNVLTARNHDYASQGGVYDAFATHGTSVAGIIAARDNEIGVRGVAPRAKIFTYNAAARGISVSDHEANAMFRGEDADHTAVSSNSWGFPDTGLPNNARAAWERAVERGVTEGYGGKGIFYVWAAGNGHVSRDDNSNLDGRANFHAVTAVCAIGYDDVRSSYSEMGANLWVCAPSNSGRAGSPSITTTKTGHGYRDDFRGTSAAVPIVSGVAALVRAANTSLTWRAVKLILAASARRNDTGNSGWQEGALEYGATTDRYRFNHEYGFGVVDAAAAVALAVDDRWAGLPSQRSTRASSGPLGDPPGTGLAILDGVITTSSVTLDHHVGFVEFMQIEVELRHEWFRDLRIELVSPAGNVSVLSVPSSMAGPSLFSFSSARFEGTYRFGSAKHLGESAAGAWTLFISDHQLGDAGVLKSWKLKAYGHGHTPGYPSITTVDPGRGSFDVTWSAPDDIGGSDITSYDIRYILTDDPDSTNWTEVTNVGSTSALQHTLSGLEGDAEFHLAVRAVNDAGAGPWSDSFTEETEQSVPNRPRSVVAAARDGGLAVSWGAPSYVGVGSPTSYDVRYIRNDASDKADALWTTTSPAWATGGGDLRYVIRGLDNGVLYDVQVLARNDAGPGEWSRVTTGTPAAINSPAQFPNIEAGLRSVLESTPAGVDIGEPVAARDDESDTLTYSLTSGGATFEIVATTGQLRTKAALDHETHSAHTVTVAVHDGKASDGSTSTTIDDTISVTITVNNVEETPEFPSSSTTRSVDEDIAVGRNVGAPIEASDGDRDTLTYSLGGADAASFAIVATSGQLQTKAALDFETAPTHVLVVDVSDRKDVDGEPVAETVPDIDDTVVVTVTVNDVNEPPSVHGPESIEVAENTSGVLNTYSAIDPERVTTSTGRSRGRMPRPSRSAKRPAPTVRCASRSRPTSKRPAITAATTSQRQRRGLRRHPHGPARHPGDCHQPGGAPRVRRGQHHPQRGRGHRRRPERGPAGRSQRRRPRRPHLLAGHRLQRLRHRLRPAGSCAPGPPSTTRRRLSTSSTVRVSDGKDADGNAVVVASNDIDDTITVTITVNDVEETPEFPSSSTTRSVDEDIAVGQNVGARVEASDGDGDALTYSLSGTDASSFNIVEGSGQLQTSGALDFEDKPTYSVTVAVHDGKASDGTTSTAIDDTISVTITVNDVEETPEFPSSSTTRSVDEDIAVGQNVGARVEASDGDRDALTYSLSGTDASSFNIVEGSGQLQTSGALDFEDKPTYSLIVSVSDRKDAGGNPDTAPDDTISVTITVNDVDEPADISLAATGGVTANDNALTVDENYEGTLARFSASDPENVQTLTYDWSVGGTDRLDFAITDAGVLSFAAVPDYERPADSGGNNVYDITVNALDSDGKTGSIAVTVTVDPVSERPVITGPENVGDYPENSSTSKRVGAYSKRDPEGAGVTWSDLSERDADAFDLSNAGVLTFKTSPNYEEQHEYQVRLNAYDGDLTGSLDVTVTIADVNEPPVVTRSSGAGAFSIQENSRTAVGSFTATDPERDNVTWSLASSADHRRFEIGASDGALSLKAAPDYERNDLGADKAYHVTVRATEQDDADPLTRELTGSLPVTVRVTDVNEAPTLSGNLSPSVRENTTAVGTYSASDPERVTITWSLPAAGADDFMISSGGALVFESAPDYEAQSRHTVTVRASDGPNDVDRDVTVTVTDVDEQERLLLSERRPLIGIAYIAAFEEGTGDAVQSPTWAWARSTSKTSGFTTISGATATTYLPTGADRDHYLRVTASYDDGHGTKSLSKVSDFTTAPDSGTNTAPTFPSPLFGGGVPGLSVRENETRGTLVGTGPQATDAQSDPLRYSLEVSGFSGNPPPPFEIHAISRQIRVAADARLNHEERDTYSVTVTAEDDFNATASATFDITIEDVNEPPMAVADPSVSTAEDTPVTFDVLANDSDPDDGATLTVASASQPRRGRAEVDATTQRVTYTPAEHDHGTYTFRYTASDGSLTSAPALVTVTVISVNDAPEFAAGTTTRNVSESAGPGDPVGTAVTATDVDDADLTYSFAGAPEFVVDGATGQIRVAPGVTLDREDTPSYTATVTADDGKGGSDSITVTITLDNVNDPPVAANYMVTTDEDTPLKIAVLADDTDPDTEQARLRVSVLTQPLNGTASAQSDQTIIYTPGANFASADPDSFTYRVSDGALSDDGSVSVTVSAVNDAPEFRESMPARSVSESAQAGDNVGALVAATDVDEGDTLVYSLSGADASAFEIDPDSGQITVAPGVTFDAATLDTYEVTVNVSDLRASASIAVTITVTAGPVAPPISTGGGGGGGGPSGPSPSEVDFEWTVTRDIEALDAGNDWPTGLWSDGRVLWIAENGDGADDAVYAYDLKSGERLEQREFELAEANRAPRGFWSDGETVWVPDSGRDRLFAYDLESGERLEQREFELADRNRDARAIWSDGEVMWVLDGRRDALFGYDLETGDLLGEYALDDANGDPRGIWSDGVTIWVSDHGEKDLIAYRLPAIGAEGAPAELKLERLRDEDFTELSKASNNSPRGIWSDGDVMYVADESDDKAYTYNMPDAIDARLASLTLSGVEFGEFDRNRTDYEGAGGEGVTETTVTAEALQRRTRVDIDPPDADEEADGHQVTLEGLAEITATVTSAEGSRTKTYRVTFEAPPQAIALTPVWTSTEWPGTDGIAIADALRDGGLADTVIVVYHWDETTSTWLAFFPGLEDVPGLNTLATLRTGTTYWIAVSEAVSWTIPTTTTPTAPDQ